ncbi:uncharacterized protein LOC105848528 [Hydra vulgaris]|uniref:uncharacterized protein LOC105848528 n=1 Tax=Hydra vulgaris TaxID=6087 RepID=UPI001F5F2CF0|nr:uncharacterized protein LOC105848528 [Hydra vulgaris]XP_047135272.1 uncharacterized protein LOC105848528 [Hydra vulgaris]
MNIKEVNVKTMQCSICNFSETGLDRLVAHIRSHIKPEPTSSCTSYQIENNPLLKTSHNKSVKVLENSYDDDYSSLQNNWSPDIEVTNPRSVNKFDMSVWNSETFKQDYSQKIFECTPRPVSLARTTYQPVEDMFVPQNIGERLISNSISNYFPVTPVQIISSQEHTLSQDNTIQNFCQYLEAKGHHHLCCLNTDCLYHKHLRCNDLANKTCISTVLPQSHSTLNFPVMNHSSSSTIQNALESHSTLTFGSFTSTVQNNLSQSSSFATQKSNLVLSEATRSPEGLPNIYFSDNPCKIAGALNNYNHANNSLFKLPNNGMVLMNSANDINSIVSSLSSLEGLLLIPLKSTKEVSVQTDPIENLFFPKQLQVACVQTELKMGQISECDFNVETTTFPDFCSTEGFFECLICGDDFISKVMLQEHNIQKHSFFCDKCDHVSNNATELLIHKNTCGKTDPQMICQDCEEVFISLKKLNQHRIKTHKVRMPFRCGICSTPFEHHSFVLDHISMHEEITLEFKCRYCNKNFQTADALSKHYVRHKSVKVVYECRFCKLSFDSNKLLIEHIGIEHVISDTLENEMSPSLNKKTDIPNNENLSSINNLVTTKKLLSKYKGGHICKSCMLIFKSNKFLVKHKFRCVKKMQGVASFTCDVCAEFFISDALKKQHLKIHHKRFNGYRCIKCFKVFKTWMLLKDHTERLHTKISCDDCGEIFIRMTDLNSHNLIFHKKPISDKYKPESDEFNRDQCDLVMQTSDLNCHEKKEHTDLSIATTDATSNLSTNSSSMSSTLKVNFKGASKLATKVTPNDLLKTHYQENLERVVPKTILNKNMKFICSVCNKVTKTSIGLQFHHTRVHGMKKVNNIKKIKLAKLFHKREKCIDLPSVDETKHSSVVSESDQKAQEFSQKNISVNSEPNNCHFQLMDSAKITSTKNQCSDLIPQQHKCLKCKKLFSNYRGFLVHFRKTHKTIDSVENQSTSSISTVSDLTPTLFKKKLPYSTLDSKISLDCPKCERTFARRKALVTHMLTRHQIMEKNHLEYWPNGIPKLAVSASNCTKCKKKFSYKGAMVKHWYECKGRRSVLKNSQINEQKNVENVPKNNENALCVVENVKGPPACFICDRLFNTKRDLILHEFKVHGIRWMGQKRILPKKVRNLPKINEFVFPKGKKKRKIRDNETIENKRKRLVVKNA